MPAANKTPNIELNQWLGNEYPKRQDFVDDNLKIDTAIKNANDVMSGHLNANDPHPQYTTDVNFNAHIQDYVRNPAYAVTAGNSTAYTVTTNPALATYAEGVGITIKPHVNCEANPTLNWCGLGAVPLLKQDGTAFSADDMVTGRLYSFKKVGTSFLADSSSELKLKGQRIIRVPFAGAIDKGDLITLTTADAFTKLTSPDVNPANVSSASADITRDGVYAVCGTGTSPYIYIYKRTGDVWAKLANPDVLPGGMVNSVSFSPDGVYLAVGCMASPYIYIYKRTGDVWAKLANPDILPTGMTGVSFSGDGVYLGVTSGTALPTVSVYKQVGDTFTKLSTPYSRPASANCIDFSDDGAVFVIGSNNTPCMYSYIHNGDTWTKSSTDPAEGVNSITGIAISPDGTFVAVAATNMSIYKRNASGFYDLLYRQIHSDETRTMAFSKDGKTLACAVRTNTRLKMYSIVGDVFTVVTPLSANLPDQGMGCAFTGTLTPDLGASYLIATSQITSPGVHFYKQLTPASLSNGELSDLVGKQGAGYAIQSGILNEVKKVMLLWSNK